MTTPTSTPYGVAQKYAGQREGYKNDLLNNFLNGNTSGMTSAEYAWCSRFVKQAAAQAGVDVSQATDMARSWLKVGQPVDKPAQGDVVVLSRGNPNSQYGHVGFYEGTNPDGSVRILSGNHNDAVGSGAYPANRVLGYRRLIDGDSTAPPMATADATPASDAGNGATIDSIVNSVFPTGDKATSPTGGGLFGSLGGVKIAGNDDTMQAAQQAQQAAAGPQFQHTPLDPARLREVIARRPTLGFRSA